MIFVRITFSGVVEEERWRSKWKERKKKIKDMDSFFKSVAVKGRRMLESIIASENSEELEKINLMRDVDLILGCE